MLLRFCIQACFALLMLSVAAGAQAFCGFYLSHSSNEDDDGSGNEYTDCQIAWLHQGVNARIIFKTDIKPAYSLSQIWLLPVHGEILSHTIRTDVFRYPGASSSRNKLQSESQEEFCKVDFDKVARLANISTIRRRQGGCWTYAQSPQQAPHTPDPNLLQARIFSRKDAYLLPSWLIEHGFIAPPATLGQIQNLIMEGKEFLAVPLKGLPPGDERFALEMNVRVKTMKLPAVKSGAKFVTRLHFFSPTHALRSSNYENVQISRQTGLWPSFFSEDEYYKALNENDANVIYKSSAGRFKQGDTLTFWNASASTLLHTMYELRYPGQHHKADELELQLSEFHEYDTYRANYRPASESETSCAKSLNCTQDCMNNFLGRKRKPEDLDSDELIVLHNCTTQCEPLRQDALLKVRSAEQERIPKMRAALLQLQKDLKQPESWLRQHFPDFQDWENRMQGIEQ
ncbi:hypothetical protein V8J88_00340 [Massilia sp. W12]|uniref:hypothetical protein n=1 Tax=Massilia sp. W12 TaxID=3126507 RepID=UPI0030D60925